MLTNVYYLLLNYHYYRGGSTSTYWCPFDRFHLLPWCFQIYALFWTVPLLTWDNTKCTTRLCKVLLAAQVLSVLEFLGINKYDDFFYPAKIAGPFHIFQQNLFTSGRKLSI